MNVHTFVKVFIGFVFVLMLCWLGFVGVVAYKVSTTVSEQGIAGVVQTLWCGKQTNCKVPGVDNGPI